MILALFIWVLIVILSLAFLFSYLLWSPRSKSPYAIALEIMTVSTQASFVVGAVTIFLVVVYAILGLFNFLPSF